MDKMHQQLVTYSYNITGSYEDSRDLVQDVIEKYIQVDKTAIQNEKNYLIRSVINHSINFKKRQKKMVSYGTPLPEPVSNEQADHYLISAETASFSLLILMENLTPKERAVFVLKEGFGYSHDEIASLFDITSSNTRKLLSRAKEKLHNKNFTRELNGSEKIIAEFVQAIRQGEIKTLENLLSRDIRLSADGGTEVKVAASLTIGIRDTVQVLTYVYQVYQKNIDIRFMVVNHQPALVYYKGNQIISCQVFEIEEEKIHRIYSVVDPRKLKHLL